VNLKDYASPLIKMWWLILAAVLVAGVSSFLVTRQQPMIYQSRATLMVGRALENPNPNNADLGLTQALASTYADVAKRENVRDATMTALGLSELPQYTVKVVPNTELIEIAVVDTNPQRAQAVAGELTNQLIKLSPTGSTPADQPRQSFIDQQLNQLEANIKGTQDEISNKQAELAQMFSARQIADTQALITALENKLTAMQANYASLLQSTKRDATNTITIVEPPTLPSQPIGPNKKATILLAVAIGFILAAAGAYLVDYLDDTLKNPEDIQKTLGLATLGAVPRIGTDTDQNGLLLGGPPTVVEAYNVLRTNLQFAAVADRLGLLLITSPSPHEGKSLTAANLSIALAQASKRVILIDADLRRPHLHKLFGLSNSVGVTSALLQANLSFDSLLCQTVVPGLRVLTSGPLPPNPSQLLSAARMQELLAELEAEADIVILDSPPATAVADAAILSTYVDGVLLVVDAGSTRRDPARKACEALKQVNAPVIGVTLNRMPRGGDYYYYYRYDNGPDASLSRRNGHLREGQMGAIKAWTRQDRESMSSDS
jgi:polysaccharide biosynthesis transport protein